MVDRSVAIIGGGPVGLLTALCALDAGLEPRVYERGTAPREGTRSIGLHPPALEILDRLGIVSRFIECGVRVRRGIAYSAGEPLGTVDFASCPGAHKYVLTIPQCETERLLREALEERAPGAVQGGHEVSACEAGERGIRLELCNASGVRSSEEAAVGVACDGKRSVLRDTSTITFRGGPYDGAYAMADFPDATQLGSDAAIFLAVGGLVESFPLPGGLRRWVIRRDVDATDEPRMAELVSTIERRTGHRLSPSDVSQCVGFRAEHYLASALALRTLAFAGDAAHVVSPIGGQGMNLGFLGAATIVCAIAEAIESRGSVCKALARNGKSRRRVAKAAARRAELNMWLGRPTTAPARRARMLKGLLREPLAGALAAAFTMRGLALGI